MLCVVSDHPIVVTGVRGVLTETSPEGHVAFTDEHRDADVVVYDAFNLAPAGRGIDELRRLVAAHPGRVLVLSRLLQPALTARALAAGAVAPVSIGADGDELLALVEATARVRVSVDLGLARANLERLTRELRVDAGLTPREQAMLELIAAGYTNDEIAAELYVSINTVKTTIRRTYARLGVRTRAQAVAWAVENGYAAVQAAANGAEDRLAAQDR